MFHLKANKNRILIWALIRANNEWMNAFFETPNGFNFQIIDPLIESRGVRLTWFDCKHSRGCGNKTPSQNTWVSGMKWNEIPVLNDAKYREKDILSIFMVMKWKHLQLGKGGNAIKKTYPLIFNLN